jgi:hypothetical protein
LNGIFLRNFLNEKNIFNGFFLNKKEEYKKFSQPSYELNVKGTTFQKYHRNNFDLFIFNDLRICSKKGTMSHNATHTRIGKESIKFTIN